MNNDNLIFRRPEKPKGCLNCRYFLRTLVAYDNKGRIIEGGDLKTPEVTLVDVENICLKGYTATVLKPWMAKHDSVKTNGGKFVIPHCYESKDSHDDDLNEEE